MNDLLRRNNNSVTVHSKRSKIPTVNLSATLQLVCEDRVLFVWVNLDVSSCSQQHPKCERAVRLPSFVSSTLHRTQKTKIYGRFVCRFRQLCLFNHSELHTCSYVLCISKWPIRFTFPSESSCIFFSILHLHSKRPCFATIQNTC